MKKILSVHRCSWDPISLFRPDGWHFGRVHLRRSLSVDANVYTNAWMSVYTSRISPDGTDMSGENRITHNFVSSSLGVRQPVYLVIDSIQHPSQKGC